MEPQANVSTGPAHLLGGPTVQKMQRRRMKSIFITGILQIIGGAIMILCGLVVVCIRYNTFYRNRFDNSICGIWSGGMLLAAGIVGVLAANRPVFLKGLYMCMSLVALCFSIIAIAIGAVSAAHNVHYYKEHPGYHHNDDPDYPDQHGISLTKLSFHLLLCVVGSMELIICTLAAVFCCTVICPGTTVEQSVSYNAYPAPQGGPHYMYPALPVQPGQQPSASVPLTKSEEANV